MTYPTIGGVPLLVRDPSRYLAEALASVERGHARVAADIAEAQKVAAMERRQSVGECVLAALGRNLALLEEQRHTLRAMTSARARTAARARRVSNRVRTRASQLPRMSWLAPSGAESALAGDYGFEAALEYLRSDWAGTPAGERRIAAIEDVVAASVARHCPAPGHAAYIGAGLGRHAFNGGKLFASVLAVELSYAAASLHAAVRAGPVEFGSVHWRSVATDAELARTYRATFPVDPDYGSNVAYVVADALALPVADNSLDAVVSIFFTDVLPLSKLLPEVKRVLRPGGRFISVGPLQYHFEDRSEYLTYEELKRAIPSVHGMTFEPGDTRFELPYLVDSGNVWRTFPSWSFVATRR